MRTWTGIELRYLIRMYPVYPAKVIGHFLDRPEYSVYNKATEMGLEKSDDNAIYAINPMSEEMVCTIAGQLNVKPIQSWDIREYIEKNKKALMEPRNPNDEIFFDED